MKEPVARNRPTFAADFRRFFLRGLSALLPTIITLWLFVWVWNFLWTYIGRHLIWLVKIIQYHSAGPGAQWGYVDRFWDNNLPGWVTQLVGVVLAMVLVYMVGLLVGNLIGRTFWKIGESLVMKVPVIRAIYPAVKQVTDFFLTDQRAKQFEGQRVVAIQPHENGIWTIGLVTGSGPGKLTEVAGDDLVNVFCPNSPAAFSGYLMVVPRSSVVELPMTVEEAMRLFVSGGVIVPPSPGNSPTLPAAGEEVVRLPAKSPENAISAAQRRAG